MKNGKILIICLLSVFNNALGQISDTTTYNVNLDVKNIGALIPSTMYGIFFEDINFGADGGLYAEIIKNRSFEFPHPFVGWLPYGNVKIETTAPCFDRNPHYARIHNQEGLLTGSGLYNEGFSGIGLQKDTEYRFSVYTRLLDGDTATIVIRLYNAQKDILTESKINFANREWGKKTIILKSSQTCEKANFRLDLTTNSTIDIDHASLFPVDTWKRRENGMRKDLAQALFDLKPGVFRFPGGCIVEGATLDTRYQWKNTVGPVENRPINMNSWNYATKPRYTPDYFQSYGLGFFEFFQLSEDFGAEPLPIISCGLSCQFGKGAHACLNDLDEYIHDALDLIEFANGSITSKWGKIRAEMGHPAPFNLKYLGVGNEQWGNEYIERLEPFVKVLREKHPEIKIVGGSGPRPDGKEFDELWPYMRSLKIDLVDEHFYRPPAWFLEQADRYDEYDRKGPKVFAGEYACHDHEKGKANNFNSALSEAAFMTGLERNADVVYMATYAPLFAHKEKWQWKPDLIWFDNLSIVYTPNYYVQKFFGNNPGTHVLKLTMDGEPLRGQNGLYASATIDKKENCYIIKLINNNISPNNINIVLDGIGKKQVLAEYVSLEQLSSNLNTENTFEYPNLIVPISKKIKIGKNIKFVVEANSINVIKVGFR